jgi:hypothetical protein
LYREEASIPEGRRTGRESSRSDQRISEAIVRYDYGCFGTLGSQSARTLVARAERTRSSAGRTSWCQEGWSLGPRGPGRAPTLPLPESLSIVTGSSPCLRIFTRRRRVVSDQYFCCLRTYLIIRVGTSGREVGGGDGSDHGTSGNLRNSLESEGSQLPFRRSGVPGRDGPQWRAR